MKSEGCGGLRSVGVDADGFLHVPENVSPEKLREFLGAPPRPAGAGGNLVTITVLCIVPLLINSGYSSISAVVKAELFPAHVRALGVALPYALANAVFGGTAEAVALRFKGAGLESGFYLYIAGILAVGLLVALLMRDTRRTSLIQED